MRSRLRAGWQDGPEHQGIMRIRPEEQKDGEACVAIAPRRDSVGAAA